MATDHHTDRPGSTAATTPDGAAVDTEVPADAEVAATCPYCERPFASVQARDLHVGQRHRESCSDEELAAFEEADQQERDDLFLYHIKAVILIGLTWGAFVILYMVALGSGIF